MMSIKQERGLPTGAISSRHSPVSVRKRAGFLHNYPQPVNRDKQVSRERVLAATGARFRDRKAGENRARKPSSQKTHANSLIFFALVKMKPL
jgi:hypothetical protein